VLDALLTDAHSGRDVTLLERESPSPPRPDDAAPERAWICLPLRGPDRTFGMLALAFPSTSPPSDVPEVLAAVLAAKLEELEARGRLEAHRNRQAGWFKTMDEQIHILERERQKLSALVNMTDAGVFVTDPDGRVNWINPVISRRVGAIRSDASGVLRCADLLCHSGETTCPECPVSQVMHGNPVAHKERREERGGQVRHLYVSAFPVRAPDGKVSEVLIMLQDISDLETLRRSEARYHRLFERSADAMVMADPRTLEVIMANAQARRRGSASIPMPFPGPASFCCTPGKCERR